MHNPRSVVHCREFDNLIKDRHFFLNKVIVSSSDYPKLISFVNPYSYELVQDADILHGVDLWFSDGAFLCFLLNIFRSRECKLDRVSFDFSSIAGDVFDFCCANGLRVALLGGANDEVKLAASYLRMKYNNLNVVYARNGHAVLPNISEILEEIELSMPDVVILGLGTPLQECIGLRIKKCSSVRLIFTCGGFITQTALRGDYYHPVIKVLGLRWLQRAFMHQHVRERLLKVYPKFAFHYLVSRLFRR